MGRAVTKQGDGSQTDTVEDREREKEWYPMVKWKRFNVSSAGSLWFVSRSGNASVFKT